jgi:ABC-type sugar transport system substrate-binding protein
LTPDIIKGLKEKTIDGVVLENSVMVNRVAADMAIRLLEGKATMLDVVPIVTMVDGTTVDAAPPANFAPDGWQIEMTVE